LPFGSRLLTSDCLSTETSVGCGRAGHYFTNGAGLDKHIAHGRIDAGQTEVVTLEMERGGSGDAVRILQRRPGGADPGFYTSGIRRAVFSSGERSPYELSDLPPLDGSVGSIVLVVLQAVSAPPRMAPSPRKRGDRNGYQLGGVAYVSDPTWYREIAHRSVITLPTARQEGCGAALQAARRFHWRFSGGLLSTKRPVKNRLQDEILPH
jgi:hypothetical protein